jgi:ACS family pantothenate transporter-like MFS transporter
MCLAACQNTTQLYALRFFISKIPLDKYTHNKVIWALTSSLGLMEGGFNPGINYMIGSWYRKDETAKLLAF